MGWEDRPYYRDRSSGPGGVLRWLLSGHLSLGTWFGIQVKMHAIMVVFIAGMVIFNGLDVWSDTLLYLALLFSIVLLHEFGHCFGSRVVGGQPTEILMHPFGGLASAGAPRRPWANFVTVVAGPAVNVIICLFAAATMMLIAGTWRVLPWNPWHLGPQAIHDRLYLNILRSYHSYKFTVLVFTVSYQILLFNLLPIFPLDGGQMLQSLIWVKKGYYKATYFASVTGMIGAVLVCFIALVNQNGFLVFLAIMGFQVSLHTYRELKANGPWAYEDEFDYGLGNSWGGGATAVARSPSARAARKAEKLERQAAAEQEQIDAILAKVSAHGMQSLTWREKRALHKATERQRQRDVSRGRRGR
jgi:Zn-dependent protease